MNPILALSNSPEPEVAQIIRDGLDAFNDAIVGHSDRLPLHVIVRASEDGEVIGGDQWGDFTWTSDRQSRVSARDAPWHGDWDPDDGNGGARGTSSWLP